MAESRQARYWLTRGNARKALRLATPELSIECPHCHSAAGRRCLMEPGLAGITHRIRKFQFAQREIESARLYSAAE